MSDAKPTYTVPDGCELIKDDDDLLLLDLDGREAVHQFVQMLQVLEPKFPIAKIRIWASRGGNTHACILLKGEATFHVRMALQLAMGSDHLRTGLALFEGSAGNVLFKPIRPKKDR